jgi:hypothetical protein
VVLAVFASALAALTVHQQQPAVPKLEPSGNGSFILRVAKRCEIRLTTSPVDEPESNAVVHSARPWLPTQLSITSSSTQVAGVENALYVQGARRPQ